MTLHRLAALASQTAYDPEPNPTCPLSDASDAAKVPVQALWLIQSLVFPQGLGSPEVFSLASCGRRTGG